MQINPPRTYWQFIYYYYSTVLLRNPNNNLGHVRDNDSWRFTTILSSLYWSLLDHCSVVAWPPICRSTSQLGLLLLLWSKKAATEDITPA